MKTDIKKITNSSLVFRLERTQLDLLKMKSALNSYRCEPRTPSLFERCQSLKNELDNLSTTNKEIIFNLKNRKKSVDDCLDNVKFQLNEFNSLQEGITNYVAGARYN